MNSESAATVLIYAAFCYGLYLLYREYLKRQEATLGQPAVVFVGTPGPDSVIEKEKS